MAPQELQKVSPASHGKTFTDQTQGLLKKKVTLRKICRSWASQHPHGERFSDLMATKKNTIQQ